MKFKTTAIQIWFLDEDLHESAKALSNKHLNKTIYGCFSALVSARMYCIGIRSKKFYAYYFNKDHVAETLEKNFPLWPFAKKPEFKSYDSKSSKWCRQCNEHYQYVKQYLSILLEESANRFHKQHMLDKFIEWETFDAPRLNMPNANIKHIVLPWKALSKKYRRANIVEGYRLQYKSVIGDPFVEYKDTPRDIPEWIIEKNMIVV